MVVAVMEVAVNSLFLETLLRATVVPICVLLTFLVGLICCNLLNRIIASLFTTLLGFLLI